MRFTENNRKRVLLVEDIELNRDFYTFILRDFGFDVVSTESGIEAIPLIINSERPFDFIFINFMLPGMLGDIVIRELASGNYDIRTVVLFTSLEENHQRVVRLRQDVGRLIDFHYVYKTPQDLRSFLLRPTSESAASTLTSDIRQRRLVNLENDLLRAVQ